MITMNDMSSRLWFGTTIVLSVALVLAILLLPPWSPLSITSSQIPSHATEAPVQPASSPEGPFAVATPTPTSAPTPVPALGPSSAPRAAPTPGPKPTPTIEPTAPAEPQQQEGTGTAQPTSDPSAAISEARTEESPAQPPQSLEDLIKATEDPTWKVRWDAVNALGELQDPRGIPALVQRALHDDNPHPRWRSLWALKAVDSQGLQVIPGLRSGLHDPDPVVVQGQRA